VLEHLVDAMPVLLHAAAGFARDPHPFAQGQAAHGGADLGLLVVDHGVAITGLIAGLAQRAEGKRIDVGRRSLLLEQAADYPDLDGIWLHRHKCYGHSAKRSKKRC
jgi:hypothetical protein